VRSGYNGHLALGSGVHSAVIGFHANAHLRTGSDLIDILRCDELPFVPNKS